MSRPPKLPLDRARAQACLYSNLAVPGTGSWAAGRRVTGACQLVIALCGFLLLMTWALWFLWEWFRAGKLPFLVIYGNDGVLPPSYIKPLLIGLAGVGCFLSALGWAFLTSLLIRAEASRNAPR